MTRPGVNTLKSVRIRILYKFMNTNINMNTSYTKVFEYEYFGKYLNTFTNTFEIYLNTFMNTFEKYSNTLMNTIYLIQKKQALFSYLYCKYKLC